jgi:hypothetical protein
VNRKLLDRKSSIALDAPWCVPKEFRPRHPLAGHGTRSKPTVSCHRTRCAFPMGIQADQGIACGPATQADRDDLITKGSSESRAGVEPTPGDIPTCGISHPCSALDNWRSIPVVDDDVIDDVVDTRL